MIKPRLKLVSDPGIKSDVPDFRVGDRIEVHQRILDGAKERIQIFEGDVIARQNGGISETVVVRRLVQGEGVERIFPIHSPRIAKIVVKKAGLVETLSGAGPFTVFAPTNDAFGKLPKATVDAVTGDKALLTKVLTYHVVAGKMDSKAIAAAIKAGNGKATLKTVEGDSLVASMDGDKLILTDDKGGKSSVTIADVYQSNGVIHVVDSVLVP